MAHTAALPLPRTYTRNLAEWLTADGQHVVRIERKDGGRTYRLVVAPAPNGVVDFTADWEDQGYYHRQDVAEGYVNMLITIN